MGSDAVTLENVEEGITYLFVSPNQSFDSAVKSTLKACPELSMTQVQDLVRKYCPDIREMNERLRADQPPIPRFEAAPEAGTVMPPVEKGAHRRYRPPRWVRIAAVAAPALVGGTLLAQLIHPQQSANQGRQAAGASISQKDVPSVFDDPTYKQYVSGGKLRCQAVGQYAAKCVDEDGQTMVSEASVGDSIVFTFSYDSEKIGFRVFDDASDAAVWAAEDGNHKLYENMQVVGRVVLWGTDTKRLRDWATAISNHQAEQGGRGQALAASLSMTAALPPRLAELAFGTLGVTEKVVRTAAHAGTVRAAQMLRAVELVMGVAAKPDNDGGGNVPSGSNDAVAIAANAPQPPTDNDLDANGGEGTTPVAAHPVAAVPTTPVTPSTPVTPTPVTPTPVTSTPTPVDTTPVDTTPADTAPSDTAPADTAPADTTPPPADLAPSDPTPPPADPAPSDPAPPPADTAPSDPAPSDPAPADPAPSDPAPADPAPSDPAPPPADTAPSDPAPSDPAPADPAPSDPTPPPADTAPSDPAAQDPTPVPSAPETGDPSTPPADDSTNVDDTHVPPGQDQHEDTPPPGQAKQDDGNNQGQDDAGQGDDLLILDSAWTVAA
jgi:hypothetical protein